MPCVTLVKDSRIYDNVHVLSGKCIRCNTKYYADHETSNSELGFQNEILFELCKYLKIGQSVWVDRMFFWSSDKFEIYNFHASPSAFAEFWNDTFLEYAEIKVQKNDTKTSLACFCTRIYLNCCTSL